jgi:hypothetical protein
MLCCGPAPETAAQYRVAARDYARHNRGCLFAALAPPAFVWICYVTRQLARIGRAMRAVTEGF